LKFISKNHNKGWLPRSCHRPASLPATDIQPRKPSALGSTGGWAQEKQVSRRLYAVTTLEKAGMWEKRQTRPEEVPTQGTTIRGVRDLVGFWRAGGRLLPRPAEQGPGHNSSVPGETRSGVKEQIISKETSLLSQNQIKLLKTSRQTPWGLFGSRVAGLRSAESEGAGCEMSIHTVAAVAEEERRLKAGGEASPRRGRNRTRCAIRPFYSWHSKRPLRRPGREKAPSSI